MSYPYPNRRDLKSSSSLWLTIALVLSACGGSATGSKVASDAAATPPKAPFPVAIAPFSLLKYTAPSGGSAYSAQLGTETCAGSHHGLQVKKTVFGYGDQFTACLDLDTGALSASAKSSLLPNQGRPLRPDFSETIVMPLTSEHYFDYFNRLNEVAFTLSVLGQVAAYDALTQLTAQMQAEGSFDALLLSDAEVSQDRASISLSFNVKTSAERTLLVRFGDAQQVYELTSLPVKTSDSQINVTVTKPAGFDYRDSTAVQAYLVPNGASAKGALMQASQAFPYLTTETVDFWPLNSAVTLHAGQANPIVVNWAATKDRTVILRLLNAAGQLVTEQRLDVPAVTASSDQPPQAARQEVSLDLASSVPVGEQYSLIAHLVPRGGQWDDEITSFANNKIIRIRN